jgi:hypothetical protein
MCEGKKSMVRGRHRQEANIKDDTVEIVCEGEDWIHLACDKDRWSALGSAKYEEFRDQLSDC